MSNTNSRIGLFMPVCKRCKRNLHSECVNPTLADQIAEKHFQNTGRTHTVDTVSCNKRYKRTIE